MPEFKIKRRGAGYVWELEGNGKSCSSDEVWEPYKSLRECLFVISTIKAFFKVPLILISMSGMTQEEWDIWFGF
jgi:hypothetical protein